ncbi:XRE family transcriptional regulator [Seonamhaeicola sp. S2-3]|uniref:ImmA/IrrE family metallo-endopeptidase n=1 Tax=Seonamhaeicola sp. S2-3 TaxID=1936081 RepID=UPI0009727FE8|nr:ImmA/IrrE family metallo-endopeptidase [Seonamhaeicola sp. S2-3]APY10273.1 XRE family transcriptional regulator [Seonamhaeicola sp. S2-3]
MASVNEYYPESVTHPSEFLKEILEEKQMGAKEFAVKTGKPEKTISAVLKGKSAITSEMAILFEQVLKVPAHFWMEAQKNYDEYKARIEFQKNIDSAKEWAKAFPYAKMANHGWVAATRKIEEKVINLFEYFGIASLKAFEDYYFNQKTQVAFRISLKNQDNALAIASWLRHGEIQAQNMTVAKYSQSALKKSLPKIKELMVNQPDNFFSELRAICANVGVKLVYTPCLPKAPIHGSTRWIGDTPLIQLSGRYKRNDSFWFTFFHEIGHILLHGKKYISIENIEIEGELKEYEKEADDFAAKWLLSKQEEAEILSNDELFVEDIVFYAKKFKTHPACIIGRLQHLKKIDYNVGNEFIKTVEF